MAPAVDEDHPVVRPQRLDLVAPIVRVGEAAVQQHHRRGVALARAERGVGEPDAVNHGDAGDGAGDRRRGRRQGLPARHGAGRPRRARENRGDQRERREPAQPGAPHGVTPPWGGSTGT